MTFRIEEIRLESDAELLADPVDCWRRSVEATHTFLTQRDNRVSLATTR